VAGEDSFSVVSNRKPSFQAAPERPRVGVDTPFQTEVPGRGSLQMYGLTC